jgi:glycosyltransferase involved in cell wall biosynthesis
MKVIAVIPCYNEQAFIFDVVKACKLHVDEIIVSDDNSTDDTASVASAAGGHVILSPSGVNRGAGANTKRGIEEALKRGADIIVTLDGDGQHDPDDIPALVAPIIKDEADMTIGSRFLDGAYRGKLYRRLGINAITMIINFGANNKVADGQSCLRAFSREVLEKVEITETGFSFSVEVPAKVRALGYRIVETPARCIYHDRYNSNSTMNPLRHGIPVLINTAKWRLWETFHMNGNSKTDNRTRIMIFSGFYLPHAGGAIYDTHVLARGLTEKGYDVEVVTCNTEHSIQTETIDGVRVTRLPSWSPPIGTDGLFPMPVPSRALFQLLRRKVDLVSTQTRFFPVCFVGVLVAKWHGVPLIHTERGSTHSALSTPLTRKASQVYDHTIGSLVVKNSDVCVGLSAEVCNFIEHIGGTLPVRIPLGIHPAFCNRELKVTSGKKLIYVGRLIKAKGVQDLLHAFELVRKHDPEATLTIVGNGDYKSALEELAGPGVRFLGELPQEQVADVLAESDIFIHPSYSEGQPSAVAEASAVGLPVIATDVGGTRELVADGVNGYLVEPGDSGTMASRIMFLLACEDEAIRMGRAGREKMMREYQWQVMVASYDELLKGMIARWTRE